MRIGITERGDAGLDFSWYDKLSTVDGAILITKNITDKLSELLLSTTTPTILHCTCTGWGKTSMEPNVPHYRTQLDNLIKLISAGYPAGRVVLRVDPIFLDHIGLLRLINVLKYVIEKKVPIRRIRISIYDEYPHTSERIRQAYDDDRHMSSGRFAPQFMYDSLADILEQSPFSFETCAEDRLAQMLPGKVVPVGCVSTYDLDIMGIPYDGNTFTENPQNRKGCHCLSCKTELLQNKCRCPHGCLYCYWKDKR